MTLLDVLRQDYQRFPENQTYEIYAEDVYFKDPLNEFRGCDRYRQNIHFIATWFKAVHLELHDLHQEGDRIRSDWTLSWNTPLPWFPRISIPGWSELTVNSEGKISRHLDYWHCSPWQVLRQHLPFASPPSQPKI